MKFIIQKSALARMLRVLGTGRRKREHPSLLRLAAHNGQITIREHGTEGGREGLVLEEGVCFFRPEQFLPLVRSYARAANLTIEVTPDGIQIGHTQISRGLWEISLFQNPATAPQTLTLSAPPPIPPAPSGQMTLNFRPS